MKNWISNIIFLLIINTGFAQNFPEGISYQAQVYSSTGTLLSNQVIGVQFNIRLNSINGNITWQEDHNITVNDLGHFSLLIGQGVSTGIGSNVLFSKNGKLNRCSSFLAQLVLPFDILMGTLQTIPFSRASNNCLKMLWEAFQNGCSSAETLHRHFTFECLSGRY